MKTINDIKEEIASDYGYRSFLDALEIGTTDIEQMVDELVIKYAEQERIEIFKSLPENIYLPREGSLHEIKNSIAEKYGYDNWTNLLCVLLENGYNEEFIKYEDEVVYTYFMLTNDSVSKEKILNSLISIGFEQPYENSPHSLKYKDYGIKINENQTLANVFEKLIKIGEQLKTWQIQKVLEI